MAKVPYSPIPTERPSQQGSPFLREEVPSAAFGTQVAQATEKLGHQLEGAGDELFKRAIAIQTERNESEARELDVQFMTEAGRLHADYNSKVGKDAVDGLPAYQKSLEDLWRRIGEKSGNPAVRRLYDRQVRTTLARTFFNAAGHAATENRRYNLGTVEAQMGLDAKTVEDNPQDDILFQQKLRRTEANAANVAAQKGLPVGSPQEKLLTLTATSKLWRQRIEGLAAEEPFKAATMLDENKTKLTEDDKKLAENRVRAGARAVGSANIADQVFAGAGDKSLEILTNEARDRAKALSPNDPILEKQAVEAVRGRYRLNKQINREADIENEGIVIGAILAGAKTVQELRADPRVANAIDALPEKKQLDLPARINRYIEAKGKQTSQGELLRLQGLRQSDPMAFLETDVTKLPLSQGDMIRAQAWQQAAKKNVEADPRVRRAVGWLQGAIGTQLEALGIYRRTEENKDLFDKFTGAVQSALDVWQQEHNGKPPSYKEVVEQVGPMIIREHSKGKIQSLTRGLLGSGTPFFDQPVPDAWARKLTDDVISRGGIKPTPEEIHKAYIRMKMIELYGKKK